MFIILTAFSIGMSWMVSHTLYILLSVWFAWCQVFVSGKLIHACYIRGCSIVEVVVGMICVPSLWLLLGCVRIVLIRIMYFFVSR